MCTICDSLHLKLETTRFSSFPYLWCVYLPLFQFQPHTRRGRARTTPLKLMNEHFSINNLLCCRHSLFVSLRGRDFTSFLAFGCGVKLRVRILNVSWVYMNSGIPSVYVTRGDTFNMMVIALPVVLLITVDFATNIK